jgi:hypothetical protein
MIRLIINMDIRSLHIRQTLQLDLQLLSDVVRRLETALWIHDDVNFNNEAGTGVVGTHGVDLTDSGGVCHGWILSASGS